MIVPMIKYGFLVYHRDFDSFLLRLQELGMVDIVRQSRTISDGERSLIAQIGRYNQAIKELSTRQAQGDQEKAVDPEAVLAEYESLVKEKEQVENSIRKSTKEMLDVKPWGKFDVKLISELAARGLYIKFFVAGEKAMSEFPLDEHPVEIIHTEAGQVYFVWIQHEEQAILAVDAVELKAPTYSYVEKQAEVDGYKLRSEAINNRINILASNIPLLKQRVIDLSNQLEFNSVQLSADRQAEDTVMVLNGWVPEPRNAEFVDFLQKENIYYVSEKAQKTDDAPILLKNNKFARLFEPIGSLFTSPIYGELDLTPLFAPFFMMFFGFCLGDAGYGVVMLIGAQLLKRKMPKLRSILSLVQLLALATIIFGTLTGTLFGVSMVDIKLPIIQKFKDLFLEPSQLFNLALIVGGIQIVFGMCVKVFNLARMSGWKYSISTIGWLILLIGTAVIFGLSQIEGLGVELFGLAHKIILGVAVVGIFLFNSPGKNPLINVGLGVWDTYNMATGLFGDLLSYIRLFALGLSSGILGNVFNSLAFGMAPDIPVVGAIVTAIILVAGHSINLFMAALGSLVHPMRLIFVEFYKNSGFTGGGKLYHPFKKE